MLCLQIVSYVQRQVIESINHGVEAIVIMTMKQKRAENVSF